MFCLILLLLSAPLTHAFSFTAVSPFTQCSNLTLNWTGGIPPYEITLLPVRGFENSTNNILDTNTSAISWSQVLPYAAGTSFVVVLSDATGFGTGGTSEVYTVANGSTSCLLPSPTRPSFSFFFIFPNEPTAVQCADLLFAFQGDYKLPIVVSAVIPGGNSWQFAPITANPNLTESWTIDVKQGTQLMFIVGDSTGRGSGSSFDITVGSSGNSSCLSDSDQVLTPGSGWSSDPPPSTSGAVQHVIVRRVILLLVAVAAIVLV